MVEDFGMDSLRKTAERIQKDFEGMRATYAPIVESVRRMQEQMQKTLAPFRAFFEVIQKQQEAWAKTIREMQQMPAHFKKAQAYLFGRGWYLGAAMTFPGAKILAKLVDEGKHGQIESEMQGWATSRIDDVLADVEKHFPSRLGIVKDAIDAHKAGKYTLSVPVLLAQADGLAREIVETSLFYGNPRKQFRKFQGKLGRPALGPTLDMLLTPMQFHSAFEEKSKQAISGTRDRLANRDEVMHGTQTDYASVGNSLRAVLLIDYLLGIKDMLDSHKEWAKKWQKDFKEALALVGEKESVDGKVSRA